MIPLATKLLIRIEQLEWDLAEIKKEMEKLHSSLMKSLTPEEHLEVRNAHIKAQNERLRPGVEKVIGKPDPYRKRLTTEEVQRILLEEGIKPEDNLFSSAIIEEREK